MWKTRGKGLNVLKVKGMKKSVNKEHERIATENRGKVERRKWKDEENTKFFHGKIYPSFVRTFVRFKFVLSSPFGNL